MKNRATISPPNRDPHEGHVPDLRAFPAGAPIEDYHARKHDRGKARWDCLPWPAIESVVAVLTFGANTYGAWSWLTVPDARSRYFAAAQRHLAAWIRGEKTDEESGLPTLAHAACDVLFLLALDLGATGPSPAFSPNGETPPKDTK
jgi:hypothetical protein